MITEKLRRLHKGIVGLATHYAVEDLQDRRALEMVLSAAVGQPGALSAIHYPLEYVAFLRECLAPARHVVRPLKVEPAANDAPGRRFADFVDQLRRGLPSIDFPTAQDIALVADSHHTLSKAAESGRWAGDMGLHFGISSSFGCKGRILFNAVRFMRSEQCLELGTAFGMSAIFILEALKLYSKSGHLTTVEEVEPLFLLSSSMLKRRYDDAATCCLGRTEAVLPEVKAPVGGIDFVFHDAGHSREDFVRDFDQVRPLLSTGALVLIDDIRWKDPRFYHGDPRAYQGWREIVAFPGVTQAVEIDGGIGMILVR
jgi:predicted O-methyltransferase YrrM